MRHLAQGIGYAGKEKNMNNFALVVYFTMKILMVMIGSTMLLNLKKIVS